MEEPKKKIDCPCIEIRDNQVSMTWIECDDQGNEKNKVRLSWDELFELGIEDWMIRCIIEESEEYDNEYYRSEASVFHGLVEYPDIKFETYYISPEIAEKLNSMGFEIVTGQPTQFGIGSDFAWGFSDENLDDIMPAPGDYETRPLPQPGHPDMYFRRDVEGSYCPISHKRFRGRPLIYCNPHNGAEFYYIGSAEGHEYPNLQVGDEVDPRLSFCVNSKSINSCFF
jgi:hypothetical protein